MPEKYYKIGEVMKYSRISRQTIHNYTMLGLINPISRTDSGHRLYGEDVFDRLEKIQRWRIHHTLQEVKKMLDGNGSPEPAENTAPEVPVASEPSRRQSSGSSRLPKA